MSATTVRGLVRLLVQQRDGVAAVEFAMLTPFLLLMAACTMDLGIGFYRKMQVQSAADAGAATATIVGFDADAISRAITSASSLAVGATPPPRSYCGCPELSGIAEVGCATTCPGPSPAGTYVSASAQWIYNPLFAYPGIGAEITFRTTAVVRIK